MTADIEYVERPRAKKSGLKKIIVGESETTIRNCQTFLQKITNGKDKAKVLVIGGGEYGSGTAELWSHPNVEIHSLDIYNSVSVDLICDAHYLPLKSDFYDGVWIQAVLEHVVEPHVVVKEIHRVLKTDGWVYAETPFMQQVHEGAYDFTRFTVLGHRYLFREFKAEDFGGNKGAEVSFTWSVRYLIWAITRSQKVARLVGLAVGILVRPLKYVTSEASLFDSSSGVFFLGQKSDEERITHKELVALYRGQYRS
ncbi:MAG: methyltransferase domain-containing protein [Pseudomonadota bacterium]